MRTQSGYRAAKGASGVFPLREQRTLGQIAAWGGAPRSFQFGGGQAKYCWREALPIVVFGKTREQALERVETIGGGDEADQVGSIHGALLAVVRILGLYGAIAAGQSQQHIQTSVVLWPVREVSGWTDGSDWLLSVNDMGKHFAVEAVR